VTERVETPSEAAGNTGGYAQARLRLLQEETQSGRGRRTARAELTDRGLDALRAGGVAATTAQDPRPDPEGSDGSGGPRTTNAPGAAPGVALVAVGGYGRG
jgi:[protein-PII] uridylyltransferase